MTPSHRSARATDRAGTGNRQRPISCLFPTMRLSRPKDIPNLERNRRSGITGTEMAGFSGLFSGSRKRTGARASVLSSCSRSDRASRSGGGRAGRRYGRFTVSTDWRRDRKPRFSSARARRPPTPRRDWRRITSPSPRPEDRRERQRRTGLHSKIGMSFSGRMQTNPARPMRNPYPFFFRMPASGPFPLSHRPTQPARAGMRPMPSRKVGHPNRSPTWSPTHSLFLPSRSNPSRSNTNRTQNPQPQNNCASAMRFLL